MIKFMRSDKLLVIMTKLNNRNLEKLNAIPLRSTSVKIISDIAFAAASLNVLRN